MRAHHKRSVSETEVKTKLEIAIARIQVAPTANVPLRDEVLDFLRDLRVAVDDGRMPPDSADKYAATVMTLLTHGTSQKTTSDKRKEQLA